MSKDKQGKTLSTTALAKSVGKEAKELFLLLAERGWMHKEKGKWRLSSKGEFEGGSYQQHSKFGEYIVWPASLASHAIFDQLPEAPLSAASIGKKHSLGALQVNALMSELGWIEPHHKGWRCLDRGLALGAQQHEQTLSGVPYVSWAETILENEAFIQGIKHLRGESAGEPAYMAMDGHNLDSKAHLIIDNFLYVNGLAHAYQRELSVDATLRSDFYLPQGKVYIEYWGDEKSAGAIKQKLIKQETYQQFELKLIELQESDLAHLDRVLAKALLRHGIFLA